MKATIYSRFSSELQRSTSIEDQERNCRRRAEAEGWTVTATFADEAMSGSDANRPQFLAMQQAALAHEFDVLLVDDLSRFARDSVEQERVIRRLEFNGLRIISTSDGYDSQSKARKIHRGVRGLLNEVFLDDLAEKIHRGQTGQALKGRWNGGRPYGYRLRPLLDPSKTDAYGQPAKIGTVLEAHPEQSRIVAELFQRFADGESTRSIASDLNRRRVPSSGSTWKRKVRRCSGWTGSAVRAIVTNCLYTGALVWNTSQFIKDPDTGKYKRRARPRSEWVEFQDESLRIVSDSMFTAAQERTHLRGAPIKVRAAKFLLSGLLRCACGASYQMVNQTKYGCIGHREGACGNRALVRRDHAERVILDPVRKELLAPERVKRMAKEMQRAFAERAQQRHATAEAVPQEIQALDAKIARLRERQRAGDPDITSDEIQVVIDCALEERRKLQEPGAEPGTKLAAMLPNAAELYRKQIAAGLDGDPKAVQKARTTLRKLLGSIVIEADADAGLWARYELQPAALLAVGFDGRGDRI